MLYVPREALHVNIAHLIVLNQRDKQPERHLLAAVEQESPHDKVHSLDVANARIILRESLEDALQALLPLSSRLLEDLLVREGACDVALNLSLLPQANEVLDAEEAQVALSTLLDLKPPATIRHLKPSVGRGASVGLRRRLTGALEAMRAELLLSPWTLELLAGDSGLYFLAV